MVPLHSKDQKNFTKFHIPFFLKYFGYVCPILLDLLYLLKGNLKKFDVTILV